VLTAGWGFGEGLATGPGERCMRHSGVPKPPRILMLFSERELSPVRLSSVCLSSVTFVRPTQPVQIFGNFSTALMGTLAIR